MPPYSVIITPYERKFKMGKEITETKKGLSACTLKIIACITMFIDHFGSAVLEKGYLNPSISGIPESSSLYNSLLILNTVCRSVGRLAMPIFYFLMVEGFIHTRSRWKYLINMLIFAVISEVPFDIAFFHESFHPMYQNIYFNLAFSLLMLIAWDKFVGESYSSASAAQKTKAILSVIGICIAASLTFTDYYMIGPVIALIFYLNHDKEKDRNIESGIVFFAVSAFGMGEFLACFDFILFHFYNGKRGRQLKYLFYAFYPGHILILILIRYLLFNTL